MNAAIASAITRHILTAIGGGLVVKYGIDGATIEAVIGGASALVGLVWSIWDKKNMESK